MINAASPFLTFAGHARDPIVLYQRALGAEVVQMMRWGDMPGHTCAPDQAERVMFGRLDVGAATVLVCDAPGDVNVTQGNHLHVLLQCTTAAEVDAVTDALADGGEVRMAPSNTFWGARYAQVTDRFGVTWALNGPPG